MLKFIREQRWKVVLVLLLVIVLGAAYTYRLTTFMPAFSLFETSMNIATRNIHAIWNQPDYLPYKLILWPIHALDHHAIAWARALSAAFALGAVLIFFYIASRWYSARVGVLATILFALSSGVLFVTKIGYPFVLQFAVLVLFAAVLYYQTHRESLEGWQKTLVTFMLTGSLMAMLYVPGMIWFFLLGIVFFLRQIIDAIRELRISVRIGVLLFSLVLLMPLLWVSAQNIAFARLLFGFSDTLPTVSQFLENIRIMVSTIFYKGIYNPEISLVGASALSIIDVMFLFFGLFAQFKRPMQRSNIVLLGALLLGIILVGLGGPVTYLVIIPVLYLLIASGIYYFLHEWLRVFPRNRIARGFGVTIMTVLILFSIAYHARAYFAAWVYSPETRAVFQEPHPID